MKRAELPVTYILFFLLAVVWNWLCCRALGGPFISPDSLDYLGIVTQHGPGAETFFPALFRWVLKVAQLLGIETIGTLSFLFGLRAALLLSIFRKFTTPKRASCFAALMLILPELMLLNMSVWSESLFLLLLTLIARLLLVVRQNVRILGIVLAFGALLETRHSGFFFIPAVAIALSVSMSFKRLQLTMCAGMSFALVLLSEWAMLNFVRTNDLFRPSRAALQCFLPLAAYNQLNYCAKAPSLEVCGIDSQRQFIGNPAVSIESVIFDRASPLRKKIDSGDRDWACRAWREVRSVIFEKYPLPTLELLSYRAVAQLGLFNATERAKPSGLVSNPELLTQFDAALQISNPLGMFLANLSLLAILLSLFAGHRSDSAILLFLVVGGLSHALAIAIVNPFTVLRYMAIQRYLFMLGGFVLLIQSSFLAGQRTRSKPVIAD